MDSHRAEVNAPFWTRLWGTHLAHNLFNTHALTLMFAHILIERKTSDQYLCCLGNSTIGVEFVQFVYYS